MEGESIAEAEGDRDQCRIFELPLDMMEEIFAKLSIKQIADCRMVCKEWNSIFYILSSFSAEKPCLLMCGEENDEIIGCMAYCFSTQKWRTLSLSFLPNPQGGNLRYLATTAQGLLLFRETPTPQLCICNPRMRSYAKIEIDVTDKFIHLVKGTKGGPYLVVCSNSGNFSFQIYHYFQDSWIELQFAGEMGSNMLGDEMVECNGDEMVECNGVLFWRGRRGRLPTTIVGYNIQDGFITVAPLPYELLQDMNAVSMVAYGSSVLVVSCKWTGIIIWELFQDQKDKLLWKWKEFARMPQNNIPDYREVWWGKKCICVGDYLCFSSLCGFESVDVFTYNLKEDIWKCITPGKKYFIRMMMSFEPISIFINSQENRDNDI